MCGLCDVSSVDVIVVWIVEVVTLDVQQEIHQFTPRNLKRVEQVPLLKRKHKKYTPAALFSEINGKIRINVNGLRFHTVYLQYSVRDASERSVVG